MFGKEDRDKSVKSFDLEGFEIKKIVCSQKGCHNPIDPLKIKIELITTSPKKFMLQYFLEPGTGDPTFRYPDTAGGNYPLFSLDLYDIMNMPTMPRKIILKKIVGRVRYFNEGKYLMCQGHRTLQKIKE
jgi:hypothetical protein